MAILHYHQHVKYLGRKLTFDNYHKTELNNRIAAGWGKFHLLRHELTSKHYPLKSRIKLFNSTVTPTVMYGCTSWTLTKDMETTLQRAQRRMLRLIINTPRRRTHKSQRNGDDESQSTNDATSNPPDTNLEHLITLTNEELLEPWPEFIKRATRAVETQLAKLHIEEWTTYYLRKKWRWASRTAQQPTNRWSRLAAQWDPQLINPRRAHRPQARPCKRWDDDINTFLRHHYNNSRHNDNHNNNTDDLNNDDDAPPPPQWIELATDTITWQSLEDHFVKYTLTMTKATTTTTTTTNTTSTDTRRPLPDPREH